MTTKPDDIPQDVRSAAWDVYFKRCNSVQKLAAQFEEEEVIDLIARALLKAKNDAYEECAKIADPIHYEGRMSDYEKQAFDIRDVISQAIRNLKHETEV